jgi:copper resistance protein C
VRRHAVDGEHQCPPVDSDAVDTLARAARSIRHGRAAPARRLLRALVAGLLLGLVAAGPALGHVALASSDPADGAVLATPPTVVTLTFTEGLQAAKSSFRIVADGTDVATARAEGDGDTSMTVTGLQLQPGNYVIRWTAAGDDGHVERGRVTFTVQEPTPSPSPTPTGPASESASGSPSASPLATPSVTPEPSPSGDTTPVASGGTDVLLPIIAALAIVGVVAYLVLRRSRTA